ncbi:MAG TPA: APC family permease [Terriglobales bacterium]|nr:APC family permease [Terriglobales bacterium]
MQTSSSTTVALPRVVGVWHGAALNVLHMVGVGPFITMPLLLATLGGPQAMLGWVLGAVVALCDGLIWAELGAALPRSGGPYVYLREGFGVIGLGRLLSFLFVWQIVLTAPLSLATGCVGFADYLAAILPISARALPFVAAGAALACVAILYRNISGTRLLSYFLWVLLAGAVVWLLAAAWPHMELARLRFAPWPRGGAVFRGLGHATRYAMYDYAGYWTVNYVAAEVREPGKVIPRAVLWAVGAVAALYLMMTAGIVAALPWSVAVHSTAIATDLMRAVAGPAAATVMTMLILAITLASLFAGMLGYSRVPYAAAEDGNFFRVFRHLHPRQRFPDYSLLLIGGLAMLACVFSLSRLIEFLLVLQVFMKFVPQVGAQWLIRWKRRDLRLPFRMWLFPLPSLIALAGWLYIAVTADLGAVGVCLALVAAGVLAFYTREARARRVVLTP